MSTYFAYFLQELLVLINKNKNSVVAVERSIWGEIEEIYYSYLDYFYRVALEV